MLVLVSLLVGAAAGGVMCQTRDSPLRSGFPPPQRTKYAAPAYHGESVKGVVILQVVVDPEGKVADARALRGLAGATDRVIAAAKQWRYKPTIVDGKRVWIVLTVSVPYPPRSHADAGRSGESAVRLPRKD